MKAVIVNLKLLYQKRGMWGWYILIGIGIWMYFSRSMREPLPDNLFYTGFASPLLVLIATGCALGRLFTDTWDNPSFFRLPNQINITRRILFFIGLLIAVLISLSIKLFFPWMIIGARNAPIMLTTYFLLVFWINVIIAYYYYKIAVIVLCISYFFFPIVAKFGLWHTVNSFLLDHVWVSTVVFCLSTCLLYCTFDRKSSSRTLSKSAWVAGNLKTSGCESVEPDSGRPPVNLYIERSVNFFDSIFYNRIRSKNHHSILPHLFGRIYIILEHIFFNWKIILFLNILFFLISCITINRYTTMNLLPFFFSLFGILVGYMCIIPKSDIFIPISRRGRFFVEIITVLATILIALVFASAIVLFSKLLPSTIIILMFAPDPSSFISFNAKYLICIVMFLPTASATIKVFRNNIGLSTIVMSGVVVCLMSTYLYVIYSWPHIFNLYHSYISIFIMVVSFGFYLTIIYYDSFKRSFS